MAAKYWIGQKVVVTPVRTESFSPRDSDIAQYAGQRGEITDLYSISPTGGEVFYIYTVQLEADEKNIVLHEDEIQADVA